MSLSSAGSMYRPDPDQDEVFSSVVFPALPLHLSPLYTATRWGIFGDTCSVEFLNLD